MTTPIDTVREALGRVTRSFPEPSPELHGRKDTLVDVGRDLLEAMEPRSQYIRPGDWAHTLAQSYARRVGEVVAE